MSSDRLMAVVVQISTICVTRPGATRLGNTVLLMSGRVPQSNRSEHRGRASGVNEAVYELEYADEIVAEAEAR
jgi:hypothetical protein